MKNIIKSVRPECSAPLKAKQNVSKGRDKSESFTTNGKGKLLKKVILFSYLAAHLISAHNVDSYVQQGINALHQKKSAEAKQYLHQALDLDPQNLQALFYRGCISIYENNNPEACTYFAQCHAINPNHVTIQENYALALNGAGRFDEARNLFELILDKDYRHQQARIKLLPLYIRGMEWYYALKLCRVDQLWWHNENIQGKTVLLDVSSEWNGLGDVLMIVRYAKHLKKAGAHVSLYVRQELISLLSLCPYIDTIIGKNQSKPTTDKTYNLTTDACLVCMRDTLYEPSQDIPYLYAHDELIQYWKERVENDHHFKIGLCWQSTKMKDFFTGAILCGPRAFPLEQLAPLFSIPGVSFYNLQKNELDQITKINKKYGHPVITFNNFDTINGTFMDTAALMKNLDLVITIDTAIAHLAGGLGIPVWLMLSYTADFRWFSERTDSPLYPTMRIFRQPTLGDWDSVVNDIAMAVRELIAQ